jgi:type VI secretion system protein ImpJ
MSWKNKVVWSEGLFLRPHHFQQQDRYVEGYVEARCRALRNHSWGFTELTLDRDQLAIGKLVIASAEGVFPDGTPFGIPADDRSPPALDLPPDTRECRVYLGLPRRHFGERDVDASEQRDGLARYLPRDFEIGDVTSGNQSVAQMSVGTLRTRLLLETDRREEYSCLGAAHVIEVKADRSVSLRAEYVPPTLDYSVSPFVAGFVNELLGLLRHRGGALAGRVNPSSQSGAGDIAQFLFLQAVNRWEPLIAHMTALSGVHPEDLFRVLIQMAGEFATFTEERRPAQLPDYRHDDLLATFSAVMASLRQSLGMVIEHNAVRLTLKDPIHGIRAAEIDDRTLLGNATFVLVVHADKSPEAIRSTFPAQTKIGHVEGIYELMKSQLPGIPIRPLPVAPPQLPFLAGFTYFELDSSHAYWRNFKDSGGFAIHVSGDFPGLEMQLWAIRSHRRK